MFYKNVSYSPKTFHGVTFKPGETKELKKGVNSRWMIPVKAPSTDVKPTQQKPSPEPPKDASKLKPSSEFTELAQQTTQGVAPQSDQSKDEKLSTDSDKLSDKQEDKSNRGKKS